MDTRTPTRRRLVLNAASTGLAAAVAGRAQMTREPGVRLRLALNTYSFDKSLRAGTMTLSDVVQFCVQHRVDALDATGYYFPGYPFVPSDRYIYDLKRLAFLNAVQISGTGVRNNFTDPDPGVRSRDIQLVKSWVDVASKLGATVLRVFSGPPQKAPFEQVLGYLVPAFQDCTEYARSRGVLLGLQHHNDFLQTAEQTIQVIKAVNPPGQPFWFGNVLDIGSLRHGDPYEEIAKLLPFAVSWQIKENVGRGDREERTDLTRIKAIIDKGGYRGVLPFEALGAGDPKLKVAGFLEQIRTVFAL